MTPNSANDNLTNWTVSDNYYDELLRWATRSALTPKLT